MLYLVPKTLEGPEAVFKGLRDEEPTWFAYVSKPAVNYEGFAQAREVVAEPDHVFVVFLTDRLEVFRFEWIQADPRDSHAPIDYDDRFGERVL